MSDESQDTSNATTEYAATRDQTTEVTHTGETVPAKYYNDGSGTVMLGVEHDPLAQHFFDGFKAKFEDSIKPNSSRIDKARRAVEIIVAMTPSLDETGEFHTNRAATFGEALNSPVNCSDRALAMEFVIKHLELGDNPKMLIGVDEVNGVSTNHADVIFELDGKYFVAITTGDLAGEIMNIDTYNKEYLPLRETKGLGKRSLKDWGTSHF